MAVRIETYQFTVNHTGDREAVVCTNLRVRMVEIQELPSISPKQLYKVSALASGGDPAERNAGTPFFFNADTRGLYDAGETVGYVESSTSSTTFQRIEHLVGP